MLARVGISKIMQKTSPISSLRTMLTILLCASSIALAADDRESEGLLWAVVLRHYCDQIYEGFSARTAGAYAQILKEHPEFDKPITNYCAFRPWRTVQPAMADSVGA